MSSVQLLLVGVSIEEITYLDNSSVQGIQSLIATNFPKHFFLFGQYSDLSAVEL